MSPRRPILALALGSLILAGLGLRDWAIEPGRATGFAADALAEYGLALTARGPAVLRLLPLPHLTFAAARIDADGAVLAEGGRLTLELDPLALLTGRIALGGAAFDAARLAPGAEAWTGPLARLSQRIRAGGGRPASLALTGARLGDGGEADAIDLDLAWQPWSGVAEGRASLTWRGVPVRLSFRRLRPADLAAGRSSPFLAQAAWPDGALVADGRLDPADADGGAPRIAGRARFETAALPATLAWLGARAPLAPLTAALTLEGSFETRGRAISWPSLRVGVGGDVLEGAGALSLADGANPRVSAQATLAADSLNLAPAIGALVRMLGPEPVPLALAPLTGGDLDLRLSAAAGRVGPIQVEDLAASVLVRETSVEVAVNRARLQGGTLKGRVTLASAADPAETEVRAQGSLDRVDLGGLMSEVGEGRWLLGPTQGQFALEGAGRDTAGLLARVSGRAALAIDGGAIAGLDLADVIHRNGAIAPGALARRNGRTGFERAALGLKFTEGVGEIAEATLRGATVEAALRGRVSLPEGRIAAQADLSLRPPADPARSVRFTLSGPWSAVTARVQGVSDPIDRPTDRSGDPLVPAALGLPAGARAYVP